MGDVVELKPYEPVIEQLRRRIDELPDWCRDAVAHLITMCDVGAAISRGRGETLAAMKKLIDDAAFMPTEEE